MPLRPTLFLICLTACGTAPVLVAPVPAPLGSFSLADSGEVVRRVQQVFSCPTAPSLLPLGTLGWRRDSGFVDVTVMQGIPRTAPGPSPAQMCYKGFRVDAEGRIFALPERNWPYTAFRKQSRSGPRS